MPTWYLLRKYILSEHLPLREKICCFLVHACVAQLCQNGLLHYGSGLEVSGSDPKVF